MSRDANGNYTLPSGNPVISGTVIDTGWANPTMDDLGNEITNSLSRNGQGGMLVPFQNVDGTRTSPGVTFTAEPQTGLYRAAPGDVRISVSSTDKFRWTTTSVQLWDDDNDVWLDVASTQDINVDSVFGRTGDITADTNDYDSNQINYTTGLTPAWSANNVEEALIESYNAIEFLSGSIVLKGVWNAQTNVPDLENITKINGDYWVVSVEGLTVLPKYIDAPDFVLPYLPMDRIVYIDDGVNSGFAQLRPDQSEYLELTGGTMLGQIVGITPVNDGDLTRKDYVDAEVNTKLSLTGGTMSGQIIGIAPVNDGDLTRKDYVDQQITAIDFPVDTVHGRTGDVVGELNDYNSNLIDYTSGNTPAWSATNVEAALEEAYSNIEFLAGSLLLKGAWDADINSPDLTTIPKINGDYWIVSVEGSTVLPLFPGQPAFILPYLPLDRILYIDDGVDSGFTQLRPDAADFLPLTGGTMLGQIVGITPVGLGDLTRKDYVDNNLAIHANLTNTAHGATSANTVNTLMARDATGLTNAANFVIAGATTAGNYAARKDYVDAAIAAIPAAPVASVHGRTGAVVAVGTDYPPALIGAATSAQGATADTALQPGDNVSELTNDAGYLTGVTGQTPDYHYAYANGGAPPTLLIDPGDFWPIIRAQSQWTDTLGTGITPSSNGFTVNVTGVARLTVGVIGGASAGASCNVALKRAGTALTYSTMALDAGVSISNLQIQLAVTAGDVFEVILEKGQSMFSLGCSVSADIWET